MPPSKPPKRAKPRNLAGYLEVMARAMFQAGISWRVVDAKWDGIKEALDGFDPERLASLGQKDIDALMADPRVIRNRAKLEALTDNAHTLLELDSQPGGFRRYLRSHDGYEATVKDLKREFRFLGDTGAYYFLHSVGEEVPSHSEWAKARAGRRRPAKAGTAG